MAGSPEILPRGPQITEINKDAEFIVDENLQQKTGIQPVVKDFKAQVKSDDGVPLIQTPPTQVITVTPPADQTVLTSWSKGPITSSISWLGMFWLRIIKKAIHFGWQIVSSSKELTSK